MQAMTGGGGNTSQGAGGANYMQLAQQLQAQQRGQPTQGGGLLGALRDPELLNQALKEIRNQQLLQRAQSKRMGRIVRDAPSYYMDNDPAGGGGY